MTAYHQDVLADAQRRVIQTLGPTATSLGYYLAGGTALALRLGHRESIDFDYFTRDAEVRGPGVQSRLLALFPSLLTTQVGDGTFNGVVEGVKVSFFVYPYALLENPDAWIAHDVRIAGLHDLAAMKLSAIAQRGHKKDFIDIHALLAHGFHLSEMLAWYREKFGVNDLMPVRLGLSYFDDAEEQPTPRMFHEVEWAIIKADVARAARQLP